MIKELLHPIAVDRNGKSIDISHAEKGEEYFCPFCKNKFIFNRSLRTGKGSRRAHFSHENLSPNCTSEGYLHSSFKLLLFEYLNKNLENNTSFQIHYKCNYCSAIHSSNLLGGAISVKVEYDLKACRPDIALLDNGEHVFAVIEIIVTHEPEEEALKYYRDNHIVIIKINLNSDNDLLNFQEKINFPTEVILSHQGQCITFIEKQRIYQINLSIQKRINYQGHSGPRIDQNEAQKNSNDRKTYYTIKNNYKKKNDS